MKSIRTVKLKITTEHPSLLPVALNYQNAANWLSNIIYSRKHQSTPNKLSKEFYSTIRQNFHLSSQVTCSLFRHVCSSYRSMLSNGEWTLAQYKKLIIPICWKRDFNVSKSKGLTIWSIPVEYQCRKIPKGTWNDSKLKCIKGQWYLNLVVHIEVPELKTKGTIIGVDSGQKNIFTAYEPKSNKTLYIKGGLLNHKRLCIRQRKAIIASVGTRSAHRLLQRMSGREKSVTQHMLHTASKQLVNFAQSVGARTVVMEDLTGIRKSKKPMHYKQKARNNRWPFAMAQFFVGYRCSEHGISLEYVSPRNTSRGCAVCGHVAEENRKGLEFRCLSCDFKDNADRNGARNIASRLLLQRQAVEERAEVKPLIVVHEGSCAS